MVVNQVNPKVYRYWFCGSDIGWIKRLKVVQEVGQKSGQALHHPLKGVEAEAVILDGVGVAELAVSGRLLTLQCSKHIWPLDKEFEQILLMYLSFACLEWHFIAVSRLFRANLSCMLTTLIWAAQLKAEAEGHPN